MHRMGYKHCDYAAMPACCHAYMQPCLYAAMPICCHAYMLPCLYAAVPTCIHAYTQPYVYTGQRPTSPTSPPTVTASMISMWGPMISMHLPCRWAPIPLRTDGGDAEPMSIEPFPLPAPPPAHVHLFQDSNISLRSRSLQSSAHGAYSLDQGAPPYCAGCMCLNLSNQLTTTLPLTPTTHSSHPMLTCPCDETDQCARCVPSSPPPPSPPAFATSALVARPVIETWAFVRNAKVVTVVQW